MDCKPKHVTYRCWLTNFPPHGGVFYAVEENKLNISINKETKKMDGDRSESSDLVLDILLCPVFTLYLESSKQSLNNIVILQKHPGVLVIVYIKCKTFKMHKTEVSLIGKYIGSKNVSSCIRFQ